MSHYSITQNTCLVHHLFWVAVGVLQVCHIFCFLFLLLPVSSVLFCTSLCAVWRVYTVCCCSGLTGGMCKGIHMCWPTKHTGVTYVSVTLVMMCVCHRHWLVSFKEQGQCWMRRSPSWIKVLEYHLKMISTLLWQHFSSKVTRPLSTMHTQTHLFLSSGFSHPLSNIRTKTQQLLSTLFYTHSPSGRFALVYCISIILLAMKTHALSISSSRAFLITLYIF